MNLPNLGNTNIIGLTNNASTNIDGVYFVNNCFTNTGFTKISVAEINSTGARNAAAGELVLPNIENTKLEFRGSDFTNMTKLTEVDLSNLQAASLSDSLTVNLGNVNGFIFQNCTALETVKYPNSIPSIPNNTFNGCTSLKNFNFSELTKLTSIGSGAFNGTGLSGTLDLSNSTLLTSINGYFIGGTQVEEVKLPNTITALATDAFRDTPNLKTLDLSNLTSKTLTLGVRAFAGAGFTEVDTVAPTGTSTGGNADSQTGKLLLPANKEIVFSNNIFYGMPNLTKAVIGSTSTTNNNNYVASFFSGSSKLKTIDLSKCESANYILNGTGGSKGRYPSFDGTAISEVKVGNPGNLAATDGQLLLPSSITELTTNSLNGIAGLTKLDLAAATSLTTIYANISNANISEIVLPTDQTVTIGGQGIELTAADQLVINGSIGSDAQFAANYFANNAVTRQIAS